MFKMKLLSAFQLATQILTFQPIKVATQILTFQPIKANFVYEVLRNYPKIECFAKWKALSSFILDIFKFLSNQGEL